MISVAWTSSAEDLAAYMAQALRSRSVTRTETTIDPTIPKPFEKKKNMATSALITAVAASCSFGSNQMRAAAAGWSRFECLMKRSMQRGSRSLHRPEIELGPKRSLMEVGGPEAQLIRKMAIGAEFRKPQIECRLASEIRGSVHDRLTRKVTLVRG